MRFENIRALLGRSITARGKFWFASIRVLFVYIEIL